MQSKILLASAVVAGSAIAFPFGSLLSRQDNYRTVEVCSSGNGCTEEEIHDPSASYVPTTTSRSNFPSYVPPAQVSTYAPAHASGSYSPSISGYPGAHSSGPLPIHGDGVTDGVGIVREGQTSLLFTPLSRSVKITTTCYDETYTTSEYTLACPNAGAVYEDIPMNRTSPRLQIHGGNLCTSNIVQYYLWESRMYQNLWIAFGEIAADVTNNPDCEVVEAPWGSAARCIFPSNGVDYSRYSGSSTVHASGVPAVSHAPSVSGFATAVSGTVPRITDVSALHIPDFSAPTMYTSVAATTVHPVNGVLGPLMLSSLVSAASTFHQATGVPVPSSSDVDNVFGIVSAAADASATLHPMAIDSLYLTEDNDLYTTTYGAEQSAETGIDLY